MTVEAAPPVRVLIVEDNPQHAELAQLELSAEGVNCTHKGSVEAALTWLAGNEPDVIVSDYHLPGADGMQLLGQVRTHWPHLPVVMVTGMGNEQTAVASMKAGAADYLIKDARLGYLQVLPTVVRKAFEKNRLLIEVERLRQQVRAHSQIGGIIGNSRPMREVLQTLEAIVPTVATVLISGESGTGKEVIARAIHYSGPRASGPFQACNCGAIPENLVESELFGHEKGAFTGAVQRRLGAFEAAQGGTLFLDEVSELPLPAQATLLRAVQERQITRVGSTAVVRVDVRIVAACNKNLWEMVKNGQFREDLFYRLNVLTVELPPLRERGDDVLLLARHFLDQYSKENARPSRAFSAAAADVIRRYHWPGNVRELQHAVQRAVILARGEEIEPGDLPAALRGEKDPAPARPSPTHKSYNLAENERHLVSEVLEITNWNITQAARMLGLTRSTLYSKIERHELQAPAGFKTGV